MIYVHIPFCDGKCFYCDFNSGVYKEEIQSKYFESLKNEILSKGDKNCVIDSIYFGGGTPSSVDEKYIGEIIQIIKSNFDVKKDAEISIEANPNSITLKKLVNYKDFGFNRISIGIQSLDNNCLKLIGRRHNAKTAIKAVKNAVKVFDNVSVDLLIGIPKQTYHSLKKSALKLISFPIKHLSCYMLINGKGTYLTKQIDEGKVKVASEDKSIYFYNKLLKLLERKGFFRYEISNFAKCGFECKHNIGYWQMKEYFGFGLSSHSFINGERYNNVQNIEEYNNGEFLEKKEKLENKEIIEEYIMLGLRTIYGISIDKLNIYGYDILKEKKDVISYYTIHDIIEIKNNNLRICYDYFGVQDEIILNLLP